MEITTFDFFRRSSDCQVTHFILFSVIFLEITTFDFFSSCFGLSSDTFHFILRNFTWKLRHLIFFSSCFGLSSDTFNFILRDIPWKLGHLIFFSSCFGLSSDTFHFILRDFPWKLRHLIFFRRASDCQVTRFILFSVIFLGNYDI